MSNEKPVALELADIFEKMAHQTGTRHRAATELRRQHARIQELEAMLEAVGAGGVSAQRITQAKDHIERDLKMVAVPVVLPEPVAAQTRLVGGSTNWTTVSLFHAKSLTGGAYELRYLHTEQQVRELLANATCTKSQTVQEPFGYFKAEPFGWQDCAETDEGAIALYEAPQPQADALDTERLDWLIEQGSSNGVVYEGLGKSFWMVWLDGHDAHKDEHQIGRYRTAREAIDAAIAAAKENKWTPRHPRPADKRSRGKWPRFQELTDSPPSAVSLLGEK